MFLLLAPPCLSIFYMQDSGPGMCQTTQPLILFCLNWGAVKVWGRRKEVCPGRLLWQLCAQWVGRGPAGYRFDSCLGGLRLEHTQWNWKGGDAEMWKTFWGQNQLIWATGQVQRVTNEKGRICVTLIIRPWCGLEKILFRFWCSFLLSGKPYQLSFEPGEFAFFKFLILSELFFINPTEGSEKWLQKAPHLFLFSFFCPMPQVLQQEEVGGLNFLSKTNSLGRPLSNTTPLPTVPSWGWSVRQYLWGCHPGCSVPGRGVPAAPEHLGVHLSGWSPKVPGCQPGLNGPENPVLYPEGDCSPTFVRCPTGTQGPPGKVRMLFLLTWRGIWTHLILSKALLSE